ncbi:hypothetical protein TREES_T100017979 [Tupaia chinensis]|uniref:Uncharacterized protein n=1 Tax=Tupaia chinensis TaxID=246437 RepID=L9JQL7_TUPCH|nr:hypothetical protein TREES_T100017979 [Tupaia chinensis]
MLEGCKKSEENWRTAGSSGTTDVGWALQRRGQEQSGVSEGGKAAGVLGEGRNGAFPGQDIHLRKKRRNSEKKYSGVCQDRETWN